MINIATLPPAATGNNGPIRSPSPVLRAHTHIIDSFIIASQLRRRGRGRRGREAGRKVGEGGGVGGGERRVVRIKPPPPHHPIDFITVELPLGRSHSRPGCEILRLCVFVRTTAGVFITTNLG